MNLDRKIELVTNWGFSNLGDGYSMQRNIYADQGYKEVWSIKNPDTIQFYKGADHTEDYRIDWSLFN